MVYVVENNGVYGLTKGQFSATADLGSTIKSGAPNFFDSIDLCALAMTSGCSFVARAFSGDKKQLVPLLSAAIHHKGTAFIDIISPCVTFANHEGSTKSFSYVKENKNSVQEIGFVPASQEITADYQEGDTTLIKMHDGSYISLKKIDESNKSVLTGLLYHNPEATDFITTEKVNSKTPLVHLKQKEIQPEQKHLDQILQNFR